MIIFVINLKRRADRRSRVENNLKFLDLNYVVVEAVDALSTDESLTRQYVPFAWACNMRSHAKAMDLFLQTTDDYAIVMEDDAILDPNLDWAPILKSLELEMTRCELDYLQLGFVSQLYELPPVRRILNLLTAKRHAVRTASNLTINLSGEKHMAVQGESRAGSHFYVISRNFAEKVPQFNEPVWVSTDGFFDRLASASAPNNSFKMARMKFSIVEQESRQNGINQVDSDI